MASDSPRFTYFCHLIAEIKDIILYLYIAIRGEASLIKVKKNYKIQEEKKIFKCQEGPEIYKIHKLVSKEK